MTSLEPVTAFFGWCTVLNMAFILLVALLTSIVNKDGFPFTFAAKMFGITMDEVKSTHFRVFQQYRFAVLALNVVPYIALKIIA